MAKKDYDKRSDVEKIESQWTKLSGLHTRSEWSAAVVRAATAAELAANLAIRQEFAARSKFDPAFVNGLLKWANGLSGKLDKILLPLLKGQGKHDAISKLCGLARKVNDKRNDIAHRGVFCSEKEAALQIENCRKFVVGLVRHYVADFDLNEKPSR
jgi:hypothetical protein